MPAARTKKDISQSLPTGDDTENNRAKRKRQSQSCDACRARKVRCARDSADESQDSCKHCASLGIPCTYDYQPKKRGPPNLYLRRLQEAAAAAAQTEGESQTAPLSTSASQSAPAVLSNVVPSPVSPYLEHSGSSSLCTHPFGHPATPSASTGFIPPSRYPIDADSFHTHQPSPISTSLSYADPRLSGPASSASPSSASTVRPSTASTVSPNHSGSHSRQIGPQSSELPRYPLHDLSYPFKRVPTDTHLHESTLPPLSYYVRPHRLDDVAPRDTIFLIISLFFDFVYPLTPCIHKPSFMADLQSRREEHDPLFFALVMSTVASTCVQVPRSYLPMERREVRKLAQACHEASRHISVATYDPPTSSHVVIRYFDTVYHFCEGHDATSHASFGEAAHIAVTLRMHEESAYEGLDPIECEIRRRVFWLLFGALAIGTDRLQFALAADKSMSILLGRPICIRDEDCTVQFPKEVDDEYITPNGILPQPQGKTAIISGLNYISRIFALLGEILVRIRIDKRSPPQGSLATARLEEIRSLHQRTLTALSRTPPPLQLKSHSSRMVPLRHGYDSPGFTKATFEEVKDFFSNPNASRENASNAYLVMQANIYVTQQLVRFVIEQYRDTLITSLRGAMGDTTDPELAIQKDREAVASDLLNVLHSIPIQSIATNGPSLVHKVRFVASTLLDAVRKAETAPDSAARAHAYLWDFLSILSEIERNYLLDDDQDAPPTGDRVMLGSV